MRQRHIARKAVKTAIIVKGAPAPRPPRRKAPGQALTASRECPWSGPGARLDVRSGPDHERAALQIVGLIIFQDELRTRPRQAGPAGVPVLTEAAAMLRLLPRRRTGPGPHRGRCRRGHARARADRGRAPAVRRPGRRPAGGRRRRKMVTTVIASAVKGR